MCIQTSQTIETFPIPFDVKVGDTVELTANVFEYYTQGTRAKVAQLDQYHYTEHVQVDFGDGDHLWLTDDQFKPAAPIDSNVGPDADGYSLVAFDQSLNSKNAAFMRELAVSDPLYAGDLSAIQTLALNGNALDVHLIKGIKVGKAGGTAVTYGVYKTDGGLIYRFNVVDLKSITDIEIPSEVQGAKQFALALVFNDQPLDFTTHDNLVQAVRHVNDYQLPEQLAVVGMIAMMMGQIIG